MFGVRKKSLAAFRSYRITGLIALTLLIAVSFVTLPVLRITEAGETRKASPAVVFSNPGAITINSVGIATPYASNISVAGVTGTVSKVTVTLTGLSHTYPEDIGALLVGPTGVKIRLMTDVGGGTGGSGGGPISGVNLTFDDAAANFLPDGGTGTPAITTGSYKPTLGTIGTGGQGPLHPANFPAPAPASPYLLTLSSLNGLNPNGTWTLYVDDDAAGDAGSIAGGWSIDITTSAPPTSFQAPNVDMDGDGESDYVVNRGGSLGVASATGETKQNSVRERLRERFNAPKRMAPTASPMEWWTITSNGTIQGAASWGDADTDWPISADFDGDDQDDFAVWRPQTEFNSGAFYWVNSSDGTVGIDSFGQSGDDPTVVGDWDGDGKDDRATYRCPLPGDGAGTCYFYYRTSGDPGNTGYNPLAWGVGELFDFVACPADYDGDGKTDACIQRQNPSTPGSGQFVIRNSGNGSVNFIDFGTPDDVVLPGDYDGDGKSDIAVRRNEGPAGNQHFMHYVRLSGGGFTGGIWGYATDVSTPGDYDGDGKQDFAIWRPSTGTFWVARSTDGGFSAVQWGVASDNPLANWYVR